jgi:streptogramin lyase
MKISPHPKKWTQIDFSERAYNVPEFPLELKKEKLVLTFTSHDYSGKVWFLGRDMCFHVVLSKIEI